MAYKPIWYLHEKKKSQNRAIFYGALMELSKYAQTHWQYLKGPKKHLNWIYRPHTVCTIIGW